MSKQTCMTCEFWLRGPEPQPPALIMGTCRRYPPVPTTELGWIQARSHKDNHCGEYKERRDK